MAAGSLRLAIRSSLRKTGWTALPRYGLKFLKFMQLRYAKLLASMAARVAVASTAAPQQRFIASSACTIPGVFAAVKLASYTCSIGRCQ
jgi:hypothetical protein